MSYHKWTACLEAGLILAAPDIMQEQIDRRIVRAVTPVVEDFLRWADDHPDAPAGQLVFIRETIGWDVRFVAALVPFGVADLLEAPPW